MFLKIYSYKDWMKIPMRNPEKHYLPTGMIFSAPGTIKSAPKDDCSGNTPFCSQPYTKKKIKFWPRPLLKLPPLVKCSKLGTDVIPNTPQRCIRWLTLADLRTPRSTNCVYIDIAHYYQMYKTLEILCLESCLLFTIWRWWE